MTLAIASALMSTVVVRGAPAQTEPAGILVKSSSPLVAERIANAFRTAGVPESTYKITIPRQPSRAAVRGRLPLDSIVQLQRQITTANRVFGAGAADIIVLVKVITKGREMEQLLTEALRGVDQSLYQMEVVRGAGDEPQGIVVKSSYPLVAERISNALRRGRVSPQAYRINFPSKPVSAGVRGRLPLDNIVELQRQVTTTNRNFGAGASDIVVIVKVITKGSQMEQLVRNALQGLDQQLYQIEVVRQ
jgi:hypothetical protein